MFYVYLLKCNDGTYYTGCTENLEERIIRHQKGYVESTKHKTPVTLVFYCAFADKYKAFEFEKYLKPVLESQLETSIGYNRYLHFT